MCATYLGDKRARKLETAVSNRCQDTYYHEVFLSPSRKTPDARQLVWTPQWVLNLVISGRCQYQDYVTSDDRMTEELEKYFWTVVVWWRYNPDI
jgi:hypothetical protein